MFGRHGAGVSPHRYRRRPCPEVRVCPIPSFVGLGKITLRMLFLAFLILAFVCFRRLLSQNSPRGPALGRTLVIFVFVLVRLRLVGLIDQ